MKTSKGDMRMEWRGKRRRSGSGESSALCVELNEGLSVARPSYETDDGRNDLQKSGAGEEDLGKGGRGSCSFHRGGSLSRL